MLRNVLSRAILFTLVCVAFASHAVAVPLVLSHQGRLLDASDAPLSGVFTIIYSIHDAPVGGTQLWMEDHVGVVVEDGLFSVQLGATVPLSADVLAGHGGGGGGGLLRYLQVQLAGQPPIMPRTQLVSTPYSIASSRVAGDIVTAPSALHIFDVDSAATIDMISETVAGKKVVKFKAGSDLAGSVNKREVSITTDEDSASIAIDEGGVPRLLVSSSSGTVGSNGQVSLRMSSVCCLGSSGEDGVELVSDQSSNRLAIKTKGTSAKRTAATMEAIPEVSSSIRCDVDSDGDGVADNSAITEVDGSSATRKLKVHNIGSSGEDGVDVSLRCIPDSIIELNTLREGLTTWSSRTGKQGKTGSASGKRTISPDGVISETEEVCDTAGASLKLTIDSTPARISTNFTVNKQTQGATFGQIYDSDGDGVPEQSISSAIVPTRAQHAINTKGTGAQNGRSASVSSSTVVDSALVELSIDDDGDSIPESEISQSVTPTAAKHAIKTKGTGADANRSISSSCDDSMAVHYLEIDDDGDGIAEGRGIVSVKSGTGSSSALVEHRLICDSDDDGIEDMSVSSSCDASHAKIIMDRDTGRSKARIGVTGTESSMAVEEDSDGDGLVERSVSCSVDPSQAQVVASEGVTEVSLRTRKGGIIKGSININHASAMRVEFDADGNGYLSNALGVGVTPTHHIDVAGGAYCDGTNWVNASDVNSKENFEKVNGEEILERISELEITKWNYKGDDDVQHIGPTAQDFKKTFGVGADDKSISTIDPSGIALAAIKELYKQFSEEMKKKDAQIEKLQEEMKKLQSELGDK